MARAPEAIRAAANKILAAVPGAVFSGIVGDANHGYGYHLSRGDALANGGDYSTILPIDQQGAGDAASALDISLPPAQMTAVVNRLMAASVAGDPRLDGCREWFGARDGERVTGWDFRSPATHADDRLSTSDDSHKWHVHISGYRAYVDDFGAWDAIADVFIGTGAYRPAAGGEAPIDIKEEDDMTPEQAQQLADALQNTIDIKAELAQVSAVLAEFGTRHGIQAVRAVDTGEVWALSGGGWAHLNGDTHDYLTSMRMYAGGGPADIISTQLDSLLNDMGRKP